MGYRYLDRIASEALLTTWRPCAPCSAVLGAIGYDLNVFLKPDFFNDLATDTDYIMVESMPRTICITFSPVSVSKLWRTGCHQCQPGPGFDSCLCVHRSD